VRAVDSLRPQLRGLDGKDYAAYQSLKGSYSSNRFQLHLDQVPKDPYAPPGTGIFRARVLRTDAGFPDLFFSSKQRQLAFRDFLARRFFDACESICPGRRGTGNSGIITIAKPGQEILERSSIHVDEETIEARFFLGLPASGRKIVTSTAETMILQELPRIIDSALFSASVDPDALMKHVYAFEDAEHLRRQLSDLGLVAFLADGSVLPRSSGIDPRPLHAQTVVPFRSPDSLRVSVCLPHAGSITGMGIPAGVTLIVGGGYHGKSTLLQALQLGIYNHVPGDGRELCVCLPQAVKIRAASGRSITGTDISAFINNLPLGQETTRFSTENASGSTSQAAFIAESIEAGARVLLMDEDTCATNFMVRDGRMQQLVAPEKEPITAFVDRVRQLSDELGISTILVMGGSSDYFDVADCVIQMVDFEPQEVTERARDIVRASPYRRSREGSAHFPRPKHRAIDSRYFDPRNEYGHFRISARDTHHLIFGRIEIELSDVEQITETAQTRAIGRAIEYAKKCQGGDTVLPEVIARVMADIQRGGLDVLDPKCTGDLAGFRGIDLASAINRVRGLAVRQQRGESPDTHGQP
jgi:predicted ABC-class ATPase